MSSDKPAIVDSIIWQDDHLRIIDQTYLPHQEVHLDIEDVGKLWESIRSMRVRGAPAIGIAAAYGMYLGIRDISGRTFQSFWVEVERIAEYLNSARPTAVNLSWAIERIKNTIHAYRKEEIDEIKKRVLKVAQTIHDEDKRTCKQIGEYGANIIPKKANVLTHCNTGSLATGKYGTAMSAIYHAHLQEKEIHVWVDETRPRMQGAKLTSWELQRAEIPMTLIADSAAAYLMQQNKVDMVIVGADRVAANGDVANKIGTYMLASLAKLHEIPFYVAVPFSTIDMNTDKGADITVEERDRTELTQIGDIHIAPQSTIVYNPAFDITPNTLVKGFITEKGVLEPPFKEAFGNALGQDS